MSSPTTPSIDYVVKELQAILNGNITKDNIITAVSQGILIMRNFNGFSGVQKKQVLLAALDKLISLSNLNAADQTAIDTLLEIAVPPMIDACVWFATSGIKMVGTTCGCFTSSKNPV